MINEELARQIVQKQFDKHFAEKFGHRLRVALDMTGKTERSDLIIAHHYDWPMSDVRKWLAGEVMLQEVGPMLQFSEDYDVSLDWLFRGIAPMHVARGPDQPGPINWDHEDDGDAAPTL